MLMQQGNFQQRLGLISDDKLPLINDMGVRPSSFLGENVISARVTPELAEQHGLANIAEVLNLLKKYHIDLREKHQHLILLCHWYWHCRVKSPMVLAGLLY